MDAIKLNATEYLMREGENSTEMYYIQSGTLGIYKRKNDHEIQIGSVSTGELVGEMSFLDNSPRSASVKAMTECILIEVKQDKFAKHLDSQPKWFKALINTLLDRLRRANTRIKI